MITILELLFETLSKQPYGLNETVLQKAVDHITTLDFAEADIVDAMEWLKITMTDHSLSDNLDLKNSHGMRTLSPIEQAKFDSDAINMLILFENNGILNANMREFILDRAMALPLNYITLTELRWVLFFAALNKHWHTDIKEWLDKHKHKSSKLFAALHDNKKDDKPIIT